MKNIYYIVAIGLIGALALFGYYNGSTEIPKANPVNNQNHTDSNQNIDQFNSNQNVVVEQTTDKDTIPADWKTYNNDHNGFTFQYPSTWTKNGEESNAINLKGEVMSINLSFIDITSQSIFNIAYHLAPYGAEVYKIAEDQYSSSKISNERETKLNTVAGNSAIESYTTMSKDIKGNIYDPALKLIHIVFLDKQKTGAFNLNFRTPEPGSEVEIEKLNKLLSTFKFTN